MLRIFFSGTPVAIGLGYLYWKNTRQAIEEDPEEETKDGKKLKKGAKSISIDGDTANGVKSEPAKVKDLTPFEQAVKHKESGNESFKIGKYDAAIEFYNKAIEVCPEANSTDLSQFYQNRAAAYEQLKKWKSVEIDCTEALNLNPKYLKALHRRARAFENLKELELCLEDVTAVAILEGFQNNSSLVLADRILKDLGLKHAKEAMLSKQPVEPSKHFVANYFKSFSQDPVHKVVVSSTEPKGFLRAIQAFKAGDFNEIIPACTEEIETAEDESEYKLEAILLRGTFYLLSGQYEGSLSDFNTVIDNPEADPKLRSNALTKRASLHMQTEQKELSFDDFEKAVEISPDNPDVYHHRGQVKMMKL